jgi:hypothetical protein
MVMVGFIVETPERKGASMMGASLELRKNLTEMRRIQALDSKYSLRSIITFCVLEEKMKKLALVCLTLVLVGGLVFAGGR